MLTHANPNCSWACSIPDYETDTLVLAGGSSPGKMVSRWGYDAFVMICYDQYCCHDNTSQNADDTVVTILVRYGRDGWVEDLPDMLIGRRDHSCSSFVRNNRRVSSHPHNILI